MAPFSFSTTKTIRCEPGAARRLGLLAETLLGPRVLLVTDKVLIELGLCAPSVASLEEFGASVFVFDSVEPDPSLQTLKNAVAFGQSHRVTGVVGFGGGSSLDVAKLASLLLGSGEDIERAWGVGNAKGPRLPLVLVPTTAGTGSEVTPVSIITVGDEEKRGVSSPVILPDLAVLDAELTLGLPKSVTAATGVDAMVHAIEAYTSLNANNNPISKMLAQEALRIIGANIECVVADGSDLAARSAMLLGSMLAGQAFANSPVAAVHALAYPIGGIFHIPHGLSNALILPAVMAFNAETNPRLYSAIATDAFPDIASVADPSERTRVFIARLAQLSQSLGMPTRLRDVGIPQDALPRMAADAMKQTRLLVNNPRPVSEADALRIYTDAW